MTQVQLQNFTYMGSQIQWLFWLSMPLVWYFTVTVQFLKMSHQDLTIKLKGNRCFFLLWCILYRFPLVSWEYKMEPDPSLIHQQHFSIIIAELNLWLLEGHYSFWERNVYFLRTFLLSLAKTMLSQGSQLYREWIAYVLIPLIIILVEATFFS